MTTEQKMPLLAIKNLAPRGIEATAMRDSVILKCKAILQSVSKAKDNFSKDDNVRWQPSGAGKTAKGSPQIERRGAHRFSVPRKESSQAHLYSGLAAFNLVGSQREHRGSTEHRRKGGRIGLVIHASRASQSAPQLTR